MIVTLTGENAFGLGAELSKLVGPFVSENGELALERLDGEEAELARMQEALTSLPFLSVRKMVVLRAPGKNKQFAESAEQILGGVPESTDVILVEPKLDKRLSYYKFLKKNTDFREFQELDANGLARWLSEQAKTRNGSLSQADARYLVERVGASQQILANELEKLLLYDSKISRETIDLLTEASPQSTIFQLLEAAFAGNKRRVLQLYAEQRALKVEPPQIVAMLTWQLHVLAIIKTAGEKSADQIASEARLNPFVVRKSQVIARDLSLSEVKQLVADLLEIDVKSKTTGIDLDEALQTYLIRLG
ncbi:MAG TPA: DNA polymerase III subunit delta [Candidatus Saccharimonadia bacterium]|nr:DNA polymerase III subunit delta [Candidatus Saccharimonadia bacterium]